VRHTSSHWLYGEDKSGDITNYKNIEYIWKNIKHPIMFITADSSPRISDDPYEQESLIAPLKFAEIVASVGALTQGGTLVIKFLTLLEPVSISMMYFLNCLFNQVAITKPAASKDISSEIYVVCLGFKGIPKIYLSNLLQLVGPKFSTQVPFILLSDIPSEFIAEMEEQAKFFATKQIDVFKHRLSLLSQMSKSEQFKIIRLRNINSALFIKKFGVKLLKDEDKLLPKTKEESETEKSGIQLEEYGRAPKRRRESEMNPPGRLHYDSRRAYSEYNGSYPRDVAYPPHGAPYYEYDYGNNWEEEPYRTHPYPYYHPYYDYSYYGQPPRSSSSYRRASPYEYAGDAYQDHVEDSRSRGWSSYQEEQGRAPHDYRKSPPDHTRRSQW
jgi:hypothetical protein